MNRISEGARPPAADAPDDNRTTTTVDHPFRLVADDAAASEAADRSPTPERAMSRYAVISDIHGNLHALEAVLRHIDALGLTEVICLGDIVGYGPAPGRCLDLVMRCCISTVRGNHDDAVINATREAEFNGLAREAIVWTRESLGPLHKDAIGRIKMIDRPHEQVMCIHDNPVPGPTDYVHDSYIAAQAFLGVDTFICLVGHTHVPLIFEAPAAASVPNPTVRDVTAHLTPDGIPVQLDPNRRYICNPGAVGQPRDADPRASYALLDLDEHSFTVHRVSYDVDAAQAASQDAGLPGILAERLAVGA